MMTHDIDNKLKLIKIRHTHTVTYTMMMMTNMCQHTISNGKDFTHVWWDLLEHYIFRLNVTANIGKSYEWICIFLSCAAKMEMISFIRPIHIDFHPMIAMYSVHTICKQMLNVYPKLIMYGQQSPLTPAVFKSLSEINSPPQKPHSNIVFNTAHH